MTDDINKFIIKYFLGPLVTLLLIGVIFSSFEKRPPSPQYEWTTSEQLLQQYRDQDNEWYKKRGIDNTYHGFKSQVNANYRNNKYDNLENAEPATDVFREYKEELDERGIELGSPEAEEIWDTYYK
jgi:hypothetical protein